MSSRILLFGHGFIGSHLAKTLHERGDQFVAVNRAGNPSSPYPLVGADLDDPTSLERIREELDFTPDLVIHCASSGRGGPDAYRAVFLRGTRHLLAAFPGSRLLFTSSTSVYGQTDGSTVDEESPTEPGTETGQTLVESEREVLDANGIVLRLAGLYGPSRSIYLQLLLQGRATIESGDVSRTLNQIHRDDVVSSLLHFIDHGTPSTGSSVYNVVDDVSMSQRECYEALADRFSLPVPPEAEPNPDRKRAWTHKRVSNAKLRSLGWQPKYPGYFDALDNDPELIPSIRERIKQAPG